MSATASMLIDVPLFELLDDRERESLSSLLETRRFDKGETIFRFGDVGEEVYIVRSGRIEIYVEDIEGEKIVLRENERGDVFGDISMLDGGPRTATAVAVEETECLTLSRENLLELIKRHPHAALDMLSVMGKRLRATNELLRRRVTRNLNEEVEERLTVGQRVADKVAVFGGSWGFILAFAMIMAVWMTANWYAGRHAFDPFPFILLNLALSTLAALQAPVIMMSQNRQSAKDRLKADIEYQVNLKAELEVAQLHHKVDLIYEEMQAQFARLRNTAPRG